MCVALSQAAMHSGMVLPLAPPPIREDPPLVAMTSPWLPITAMLLIAAVVGACATAPLVAAFGRSTPLTPRICDPVVVVVVSVVVGARVVVVISVVVGALTAGSAKSCAPGL